MPSGKKSESKREAVALLLAKGLSLKTAAKKSGIGTRTVQRWTKEGDFAGRVRELRGQLLTRTVALLAGAGAKALKTLLARMSDPAEKGHVKVSAANAVLAHMLRGAEQVEYPDRIAQLAKQLDAIEQQQQQAEGTLDSEETAAHAGDCGHAERR